MSFKRYAVLLLAILLLALGWRWRNAGWVQDLLHPPQHRPLKIQFDNGTLRQSEAASLPLAAKPLPTPNLSGIRKCRKGGEMVYTDGNCPPGSKELALANGTVTVINQQGLPAMAAAKGAAQAQAARPRGTVRDVLAPADEPSIADQRIERAINGR